MAPRPAKRRISEQSLQLAQALCHALGEVLETPFSIWSKGERWQLLAEVSESSQTADAVEYTGVEEILGSVFTASRPAVAEFHGGRHLLVAPVCEARGPELAVCGILPGGHEPGLLANLAASTSLNIGLQHRLSESSERLRAYACQVSSDFEELTWMRSVAKYFDISDTCQGESSAIEALLPPLRDMIQAEVVAFFPDQIEQFSASIDGDACLVGNPSLGKDLCRQLIDRYKQEAMHQPVVRNSTHSGGSLPGFPKVRNSILVAVAKGPRRFGWLLAINKSVSNDPERASVRAECLSEWEFGTFEAGLMNATVVMIASHARNVELFREKEAMLIGVIRALINAIEAKDSYTCGHSDRVAQISRRLAEELGLGRFEAHRVYMAGLLHDIGKIGVPDNVLQKPGKLTAEEFALIKKHPEIGHAILKHVQQLSYVLPGVLHHHEAVDGAGYPHNLAGDEIPLQGRILAVADAYDAMTSSRPYRTAMETERAEAILREGAGRQWDNRVVAAFFAALPDIRAIRDTGADHFQGLFQEHPESTLDTISAALSSLATA